MTLRRGFTLLEVMIAVAIVALAMGVVIEIETHAIDKTMDTRSYTIATLLARGKILDVQQTLAEEGFGDFAKVFDGTFEEEGFPEFTWIARARKVEVPTPASLGSGGGEAVEGSGGLSLATLAPLVQNLGSVLENAVREIEVRVLWKDGEYDRHVSVVTHVVSKDMLAAGLLNSGLPGAGGGGLPAGLVPPGSGASPGGGMLPGGGSTMPPGTFNRPSGVHTPGGGAPEVVK
jgi:prepilin-type N-terminal cleavage/methylation domain-containing protein